MYPTHMAPTTHHNKVGIAWKVERTPGGDIRHVAYAFGVRYKMVERRYKIRTGYWDNYRVHAHPPRYFSTLADAKTWVEAEYAKKGES